MPLNRFAAFWVARAALIHNAKGRAFFLGRLWPLDLRIGEFRNLLAEYDLTSEIPPEYGDDTLMDDALVCKLLGYASCDSLDFDDSEGATVLHDMNISYDHSADHFYGKLRDTNYDVVFIARKNERSACRKNPIQFRYRR